jgi:hypothetical protein
MNWYSKPTKLKKLTLSEVSLVDRGANQHARITLFKRERDDEPVAALELKEDPLVAITKLAHDIAAGRSGNYASRAQWYSAIAKAAEQQRQPDETSAQAFSRFITENADGKALFAAHKSASGEDFMPAVPAAPVVKHSSAYAQLVGIAERLRADDPGLTKAQAFAKAFLSNRALAERAKTEDAIA